MAEPDWLCPIDGLISMKYGTSCQLFKEGTCPNEINSHITGLSYVKAKHEKKIPIPGGSIGIAQISDEGM